MLKNKTLFLTLLATTALDLTNAYAGGSCAPDGDTTSTCHWEYENGVLTISGSGAMKDYGIYINGKYTGYAPWDSSAYPYSSVVIKGADTSTGETGITSIGQNAFKSVDYKASHLTSVEIPNSVTSIGNSAFKNSHLTSVTIPDSVTSIGSEVFYNAQDLNSVTLPDSVLSIGGGTFHNTINLQNITLPKGLTEISSNLFYQSGITSIDIPDSVTKIGLSAFYSATNLRNVTLPDSLTSVNGSVFQNTNIENLTTSDDALSVVRMSDILDGGAYATALIGLAMDQEMLERAQEWGEEDMIPIFQEMVERSQAEVDAAKANLLAKTGSIQINCKGDVEVCKSKLTIPDSYKAAMGDDWFPFNITQSSYTRKNSDGSTTIYDANNKTTSIYDENGNLISLKGKRIYTIEEANAVAKPTGNTVRIKYR
ncbi:MAG: leucine-rich repeat domain-containing protein [Alphaproteobacteria bacterium]|nr:leucine-rich repeat domain-containing protein [Alphaproteobacteria bacterium]